MRFGEIVRPLASGRLLRPRRPRRLPVERVHDRRARGRRRRRGDRACARRRRPTARSRRRCCTRPGAPAPPSWPRPVAPRPWPRWPTGPSRSRRSTGSSGPGNVYVTEAKRQVAGFVGIDGLAGPSELAIVADGDVDPRMAALDLIAQAEHDPEARTFFLTPDAALLEKVTAAFEQELPNAGRREIVEQAARHTKMILVRDLEQAARGGERPGGRARAAAARRSRRVPPEGAQRRRDLPRALERGAVR